MILALCLFALALGCLGGLFIGNSGQPTTTDNPNTIANSITVSFAGGVLIVCSVVVMVLAIKVVPYVTVDFANLNKLAPAQSLEARDE